MGTVRAIVFAYNRQGMLDNLLAKLEAPVKLPTLVMDDASQPPLVVPHGVGLKRNGRNFGKPGYWRTVTLGMRTLRKQPRSEFYLFLADDLDPVPAALDKALALMFSAPPDVWAINLIRYPYNTNWGRKLRKRGGVFSNAWIDGAFICRSTMLDALDWKISKIHPATWRHKPLEGSGVWKQVTHRIYEAGGKLWGVRQSLFLHGEHPSLMNPEERLRNPLKL